MPKFLCKYSCIMTRKNDKDDMMCSVKKTEYAKYVVSSGPS